MEWKERFAVAAVAMAAGAIGGAAIAAAVSVPPGNPDGETPATDADRIRLSHRHRNDRSYRPLQSSFRVTAVVVYRIRGQIRHVVGHNDEACCLLNSCCAERAAFLQREANGTPFFSLFFH